MRTENREVRAIPIWLLRDYLVGIGGRATGDEEVEGDGWKARLSQIDDYRIGSLSVGQVLLEIEGDDASVAAALEALEPKLLRAGG